MKILTPEKTKFLQLLLFLNPGGTLHIVQFYKKNLSPAIH